MDKKDIYEHLAKIYLDASLKKSKQKKEYPAFRNLFFLSLAVFSFVLLLISPQLLRNKPLNNSEIALVLLPDIAKINFNFNPAKKETFSLFLNKLNLNKYNALAFSLKKTLPKKLVSVRVEFTNAFKEKSEFYLRDIPDSWKEYKLELSNFKGISDWSEMSTLQFTVEQWNATANHGIVYIENVRLIK